MVQNHLILCSLHQGIVVTPSAAACQACPVVGIPRWCGGVRVGPQARIIVETYWKPGVSSLNAVGVDQTALV